MIEFTKSYQNSLNVIELYALYCDFLDGKADIIVPGQPKAKDFISLILRCAVLDSFKGKD